MACRVKSNFYTGNETEVQITDTRVHETEIVNTIKMYLKSDKTLDNDLLMNIFNDCG